MLAHEQGESLCGSLSKIVDTPVNGRPHRLSFNRPTKRGKEKSPSDGHCQCKKEMDDHLLSYQQIFEKEPHSDIPS
jgi:hypothetical protein